jgi:hypothetical protein
MNATMPANGVSAPNCGKLALAIADTLQMSSRIDLLMPVCPPHWRWLRAVGWRRLVGRLDPNMT